MLGRIFPGNPHEETARALYTTIVSQAREPAFYLGFKVPDSVDGRFELLVLHVFLVLHRLKREGRDASDLSQTLFDVLFYDLDQSVRVSGAGDLKAVGRIKRMAEAFYGRVTAYEEGLAQGGEALVTALSRNLYGTADLPPPSRLDRLAVYLQDQVVLLAAQSSADLLSGELRFSAPPTPESVAQPQSGG